MREYSTRYSSVRVVLRVFKSVLNENRFHLMKNFGGNFSTFLRLFRHIDIITHLL